MILSRGGAADCRRWSPQGAIAECGERPVIPDAVQRTTPLRFVLRCARDDSAPSGLRLRRLLALHSAPADVAAAEAVRPADLVDRRIGARLCLGDVRTQRRDVEHAAAVGEDT